METLTVSSGDTLWGISQDAGLSLSELLALNPQITNPDLINVGQSINLGGAETAPEISPLLTSWNPEIDAAFQEAKANAFGFDYGEPMPSRTWNVAPGREDSFDVPLPSNVDASDPRPWEGTIDETFLDSYARREGIGEAYDVWTGETPDARLVTGADWTPATEPLLPLNPYATNLLSGRAGEPGSIILPGAGDAGFGTPYVYGTPNAQQDYDGLFDSFGDALGKFGDALTAIGGGAADAAGGAGDAVGTVYGDVTGGISSLFGNLSMGVLLIIAGLAAVLIITASKGNTSVRADTPLGKVR